MRKTTDVKEKRKKDTHSWLTVFSLRLDSVSWRVQSSWLIPLFCLASLQVKCGAEQDQDHNTVGGRIAVNKKSCWLDPCMPEGRRKRTKKYEEMLMPGFGHLSSGGTENSILSPLQPFSPSTARPDGKSILKTQRMLLHSQMRLDSARGAAEEGWERELSLPVWAELAEVCCLSVKLEQNVTERLNEPSHCSRPTATAATAAVASTLAERYRCSWG